MILDKLFKNSNEEFVDIIDVLFSKKDFRNYIYDIAEAHAIDLIARTIAKCEIQTFELKNEKIKETKGDLYWTLNLQPNYNENGTRFIYKLVTKLLTNGTALIIINKKAKTNFLYIADKYDASNDILHGKTFKNITISDDEGNSLQLEKVYDQNNSIYYSLKNDKLTKASKNFKINIAKILKATEKSFIRANTAKWRLKNPGNQPTMIDAETKQPISYEQYTRKITEGLLSDEEAIIMLSEMFELINLNKDNNKKLDDFETKKKKTGNTVAQKWSIPLDIFWGNKTEKSTSNNDFITFAVSTYLELLKDGFNVSLVGKESFLKGEYIKINTTNITHKDVLDCGTGIDKLTANRFSRNEINKLLKLPEIDEDWADRHYITKNYQNMEGGAKSEE